MTTKAPMYGYAIFHLNLAFSSIEEETRPEVVEKCYWPLLRLASDMHVPLGIEATGFKPRCRRRVDHQQPDRGDGLR